MSIVTGIVLLQAFVVASSGETRMVRRTYARPTTARVVPSRPVVVSRNTNVTWTSRPDNYSYSTPMTTSLPPGAVIHYESSPPMTMPVTMPVASGEGGGGLSSVESSLLEQTNATRARHGLSRLVLDHGLLGSARRHAQWMTSRRVMQHTSDPVAENIAMGQRDSSQVMRDWMNSPGHRANILNPSYRRIGVAAFRGADGQVYWCQQFLH